MPQKKKTANKKTNKKSHKKHLTQNKVLYFNQFQIMHLDNLQDIKTIKIIFNTLQLCSKNQEQII